MIFVMCCKIYALYLSILFKLDKKRSFVINYFQINDKMLKFNFYVTQIGNPVCIS